MVLDLKIEIFAYHCFSERWREIDVEITKKETLLVYGDECTKDKSYTNAWDYIFHKAILCRYIFFTVIYISELNTSKPIQFESMYDLNSYATTLFDSENLFGDLNVFERMFATCALGHHLFYSIYEKGAEDIIKYKDFIWAMYFNKFAEEFYKEGGWNELKRVAKTYDTLFDFLRLFLDETNSNLWEEQLTNYRQFKNIVKHKIFSKKKKAKISVSMLWIKLQTEHVDEYVTVSSSYMDWAKNSDVEQLLQELKQELDFYPECDTDNCRILEEKLKGKFHSTETPYFETLPNSDESKTDDVLHVQDLTIYDEFLQKNPNTYSKFETEHQTKILTSVKKVSHAIMDKSEIFKMAAAETGTPDKNMEAHLDELSHNVYDVQDGTESAGFKFDSENSMKPLDLSLNRDYSSMTFNEGEKVLDGISSINVEAPSEAINLGNVFSTKQNEGSDFFERIAPKNESNPRDFSSHNVYHDVQDGIERSRFNTDDENLMKPLDLSLNRDYSSITFDEGEKVVDGISSGNVEMQSEAMNLEDVFFTNQNKESDFFEQITLNTKFNSRDFYSRNDIFESYQEENAYSERFMSPNFESKNEACNTNAALICAPTVIETAATFSEKNDILEKNLDSTEDCLVTNDGKMNTDMEMDKLREEQEDLRISFLRMILVLGDRQGIRHVRETFQRNEEEKKNSSKKSKKKKRSKKRSGK